MDIDKNEVFKDIEGYEGRYQVSNMGRVKSIRRKYRIGCLLNNAGGTGSHKKVHLYKNGKVKRVYIHELVARYFVKNNEGMPHIIYIDGNKSNPVAENLSWSLNRNNTTIAKRPNKPRRKRMFNIKYDSLKIFLGNGMVDFWIEDLKWYEFLESLTYAQQSFLANNNYNRNTRAARMYTAGFSSSEIIISFNKTNY